MGADYDEVRFWTLDPTKTFAAFRFRDYVCPDPHAHTIAFSADGRLAAVGGWCGLVRDYRSCRFLLLFAVESGKLVGKLLPL